MEEEHRSLPRSQREEEERQIEEAFRQITEKSSRKRSAPIHPKVPAPKQETVPVKQPPRPEPPPPQDGAPVQAEIPADEQPVSKVPLWGEEIPVDPIPVSQSEAPAAPTPFLEYEHADAPVWNAESPLTPDPFWNTQPPVQNWEHLAPPAPNWNSQPQGYVPQPAFVQQEPQQAPVQNPAYAQQRPVQNPNAPVRQQTPPQNYAPQTGAVQNPAYVQQRPMQNPNAPVRQQTPPQNYAPQPGAVQNPAYAQQRPVQNPNAPVRQQTPPQNYAPQPGAVQNPAYAQQRPVQNPNAPVRQQTPPQNYAPQTGAVQNPAYAQQRPVQNPNAPVRQQPAQAVNSAQQPVARKSPPKTTRPPDPPMPPKKNVSFSPGDEPEEELVPSRRRPQASAAEENEFLNFLSRYRKPMLAGACIGALVLVIAMIVSLFAGSSDPYDDRILNNVYLADICVGGMTKEQAAAALRSAEQDYASTDMVVHIGQKELRFSAAESGARLDVKAAVNAAFNFGRTGSAQQQQDALDASRREPHVIALLPYLNLNTAYIQSMLDQFAQASGSTLTQTTYGLEGLQPNLSTDQFSPATQGQTLVITMGTPGTGFDSKAALNQVLDCYSMRVFHTLIEDVQETAQPNPIDLQAIYDELYKAPVDASVDLQTYKPIPGSYGCSFDLESTAALVSNAQPGQVLRIPLIYTAPAVADDKVYFRDVLGEYQTRHTDNDARNTNLRLACQAINGLTLNPGEVFSFNNTVGERTTARGYLPAPAYSGTDLVDSPGGGVCQVSSTLYYAALLSDLEIVSRSNHGFPVSYVPYGLDATVSWRSPDFQFRNSTSFPIRLEAKVENGFVTIRLWGTDSRKYYVKMEYKITATEEPKTEYVEYDWDNFEGYRDGDVLEEGATGYTVKTYRVKYDNQTGNLISRDFETTSQYMCTNRKVVRIRTFETTPTQPSEPQEPTVTPTQPSETQEPTFPSESPETQEPTWATSDPDFSDTGLPFPDYGFVG